MEERVRLSLGSGDVQVAQLHPITGTPVEVLVPMKVRQISGFNLAQALHNYTQGAKEIAHRRSC